MPEDTPDEHDDEELLPYEMRVFASSELDSDEGAARYAADEIRYVTCRLLDSLIKLEDMERALQVSELVSTRAQRARTGVRHAIDGLEEVIGGVSEARDAFTFYWASRRRPASDL